MVKKKKTLRTQQWQVEEDNAYATCAKSLHDLTMNDHVSNENWYRSACYEARKLHTKKKNVKIRAIKAGIAKGSKGVTVVNKDSIDPITVKKTSTLELHHIYEVSKKHKWLVDTAAPAVDCHLDKYQKRQFKRATRSGKQRELHPDIKDWPFTLKNHASRKAVLSWDNTRTQLKRLVQTSKPAVDCQLDKWQQAQLDRAHKMTDDIRNSFSATLGFGILTDFVFMIYGEYCVLNLRCLLCLCIAWCLSNCEFYEHIDLCCA